MLWVGVVVLGTLGAARELAARGDERSWFDPLYRALQLFTLEDGQVVAGPVRFWQLELARFLAPAAAAYTAGATAVALLSTRVRRMLLRRRRRHVVVCGLGNKGLHLARDFLAHGYKVVAIEMDAENDAVAVCRDLGVTVLVGDATESATLRLARAHAARCVVAVTGSDGTNVEIGVRTHALVNAGARRSRHPVHCFVHVVDLKLRALFGQHPIFADIADAFEIRVFNVYDNAARLLFEKHPLDRERLAADDPRGVHLVVVGFGQMGESVAVQAARIGHFANRRKPRITVIDREAGAREQAFLGRHPQFRQIADVEFVAQLAEDPALLARVRGWAADPTALTTVVVAFDDDSASLSCALGFLPCLEGSGIPVVVRMARDAGLALLLEGEAGGRADWLRQVHAFGMSCDTCTSRLLLDQVLDAFACRIHENYLAKRRADAARDGQTLDANDPSLQPWAALRPDLRDSNRQQADHIAVKLRAVACRAEPEDAPLPVFAGFTPDEVETLAIMEHNRWVAERLLAGWTSGPKNQAKHQSPYLVAWEAVPDAVREYDRESVRALPALLALAGRRICRAG
jgi:voltage-gated potassium channel Kch